MTMDALSAVNMLLGYATIGMQIAAVALLAVYILRSRFPDLQDIGSYVAKRGLWIGFLFSLGGSAMTLIHSEIFNLPPCPLCWWQRIFLYPQVILFAIALYTKDRSVYLYSMVLSILGASFAIYHHALQMFPAGSLPCPAQGVSCSQILYLQFGYITYPMMALSLFVFLFAVMLFARENR